MSASETQTNDANKDTNNVSKVDQSKLKIRIRLPPKKRLSGGIQIMSTGAPQDNENLTVRNVPEQTENNIRSLTTAEVKAEETSSNPPGRPEDPKYLPFKDVPKQTDNSSISTSYVASKLMVDELNNIRSGGGLRKEASSNNQRVTLSGDTPPEKVNFIALGRDPCENARNSILRYRLLCETNSNMSSKGLSEDSTINCPSKNLTTPAVKSEKANDNSVRTTLFEARKYMATEKLSAGVPNNLPIRRPAALANDKTFKKRPHSSVVHATDSCKNTSVMKLPSVVQAVEQSSNSTNLEAIKIYEEFEEKVSRTVYLDNLSHLATKAVIKAALDQFGTVRNVDLIINYTVPYVIPQSALVEMETEKDAESVVSMLNEFPFMLSGMPRPVRGKRATVAMFNDRPRLPGGKLEFRWVGPTDPDYQNFRELESMSKRHEVENLALIKLELEGEELLPKQQQENLDCSYRKLVTLDTFFTTGCVGRLSHIYNMRFDEAF